MIDVSSDWSLSQMKMRISSQKSCLILTYFFLLNFDHMFHVLINIVTCCSQVSMECKVQVPLIQWVDSVIQWI